MNTVLKKLRRKPLRTFLTLLQIVLGALAMTLALSAYLDAVKRQNAGRAERFDLIAGTKDDYGMTTTSPVMDQKGIDELLKLVPALEKAALIADSYSASTFSKEEKLYQFQSVAYVDKNYFELNSIQLVTGSFFSAADEKAKDAVILISDGAAEILFGDAPALGQTLSLMPDENFPIFDQQGNALLPAPPEPFRIIGTFTELAKPNEIQYSALLPAWKMDVDFDGASVLNVMAQGGQGDEAREQIVTAARQVFSTKISEWNLDKDKMFFINELGQNMWASRQNNLLDPTVVMFGLFGIVALIVGSIGIFSIMLVDALERERDTGIKRALGATRARITREMTLEATLIAGLGGLIGVLLAALIIPVLVQQVGNTLFWNVSLRWQPVAALIVFGLTLLLGTVLGFFPALRAARVNPVEALKGV
jgi:ABC-type antimicrobial peptide transport system permease subunit